MNKKQEEKFECEVCGARVKGGERFCSVCGPAETPRKEDKKEDKEEMEVPKGIKVKKDGEGKEDPEEEKKIDEGVDEDSDGKDMVDPFGQDFSKDK